MKRLRFSLAERLEMLAAEHGPDNCWPWPGHLQPDGYARARVKDQTLIAHRASYEVLVGPIPEGMELDHLCRVKHCVNPKHLEPVSRAENVARRKAHKTHCKRGHAFTPENTYEYDWTRKDGSVHHARLCATCQSGRGLKSRVRTGVQSATVRRNSKHAPLPCPHPQTPENTYTRPNGKTQCRACRTERFRAWRHRQQSA